MENAHRDIGLHAKNSQYSPGLQFRGHEVALHPGSLSHLPNRLTNQRPNLPKRIAVSACSPMPAACFACLTRGSFHVVVCRTAHGARHCRILLFGGPNGQPLSSFTVRAVLAYSQHESAGERQGCLERHYRIRWVIHQSIERESLLCSPDFGACRKL